MPHSYLKTTKYCTHIQITSLQHNKLICPTTTEKQRNIVHTYISPAYSTTNSYAPLPLKNNELLYTHTFHQLTAQKTHMPHSHWKTTKYCTHIHITSLQHNKPICPTPTEKQRNIVHTYISPAYSKTNPYAPLPLKNTKILYTHTFHQLTAQQTHMPHSHRKTTKYCTHIHITSIQLA